MNRKGERIKKKGKGKQEEEAGEGKGKKKYIRKRHKCKSSCFILRSLNSLLCSQFPKTIHHWHWPNPGAGQGTMGDRVCS